MPEGLSATGVIGLGDIGSGLADAVRSAGLPLAVYDLRREATDRFAEGARVCAGLDEIGASSDVLVVSVVTDEQVLGVLDPAEGALASMRPGSTVVIVSTVALDTVRRIEELARPLGVGVVDCGVSGGPSAAAQGALVSMVGGTDEDVERVRPVIEAFSSLVVRMGPVGAGQRAKLARNVIQYGSWLAAFEGQRLAEAAGIELAKLAQVVRASDQKIGGATTLMFRSTTEPFGDRDDRGLVEAMAAAARLAHKDLGAAIGLGRELGIELPLTVLAEGQMDAVFGVRPTAESGSDRS